MDLGRTCAIPAAALLLALAGCGKSADLPATTAGGDPRPDREKPLVLCTTGMVADLVRSVGGGDIEVVALMQPGVDPHLWTPTRTDVLAILSADALFMNGLGLEGRAGDSFARVEQSGRPVVRLAETLPRAELAVDAANPSHLDPHVWMDPVLWAKTAPAAAEALSRIAPESKERFAAAARRFADDAAALDRTIATAVSTVPVAQRVLVTSHDAFRYFGLRYGLAVHGVQGTSTESEPSLAQIEALVALVVDARVPTVFAETTVSDRSVRALVEGCAARGHEVRLGEALYSDSLGRATLPEGTWPGMMRHNAREIVDSLGGRW